MLTYPHCSKALLIPLLCCAAFAAGDGKLRTEVNPGRAGVYVDGKYLGPAANFGHARTYAVSAGEHEVRLVEPRYEDFVTKLKIEAGKKTVLKETLKALPVPQPPFGILRVKHPDHFAAVYINGRFMGHVDEFDNFAQGLQLNPGTYEVKLVPVSIGAPVSKTVSIQANQTTIVE